MFASENQETGTKKTRIHGGKLGQLGLYEFLILFLLFSQKFNGGNSPQTTDLRTSQILSKGENYTRTLAM